MRIRCRTSNGQFVIGSSLSDSSCLGDLQAEIEQSTKISISAQILKIGFPPKPLSGNFTKASSLADCGIQDGGQIIIEENKTQDGPYIPLPVPLSQEPAPTTNIGGLAAVSPDGIALPEGVLVVREMKDDNSCLFRSIGYTLERTPEVSDKLRKVVANAIRNDPSTYNEAILGRPPKAYVDWILQPNSWGGAIELAIFSDHYKVEIDSIDVASLRVDRFGEGAYNRRVLVLYSGIHYDAVALAPSHDAPMDFDQTAFEQKDGDRILTAGVELADIYRKKHKYTDLANFTLRCGICKKGLRGQKEAQAHAMESGHTSFTEYS